MLNANKVLLTLVLTCLSLFVQAGNEPAIEIVAPNRIDDGIAVPVNITVTGLAPGDWVKALTLTVPSNPQPHNLVFSAKYVQPQDYYVVGARVRMAPSASPSLEALVQTNSGASLTKKMSFPGFERGTNFSDSNSLTSTIPGMHKFPSAEIGQQKIAITPSSSGAWSEIKTIIHHPMLPKVGGASEKRLSSLDVLIGDTQAVHVDIGEAMPNDPFFSIATGRATNKAKVVWTESTGKTFEAVTQ